MAESLPGVEQNAQRSSDCGTACTNARSTRVRDLQRIKEQVQMRYIVRFLSDDKYSQIEVSKIQRSDRDDVFVGVTVNVDCGKQDGVLPAEVVFIGNCTRCEEFLRNLEDPRDDVWLRKRKYSINIISS